MPEDPQDDWLQQALKTPESHIDNDEFSRRVMNALPMRRRRSLVSQRKLVIFASALVGIVCSIPLAPVVAALPIISIVVASQWFLTIELIALLGAVAFVTWWLAADRI